MPTSVQAFFNQKVPEALSQSPDKAKDIAAVYAFNISGPDGGTWTVDLLANPPTCAQGIQGTPQCTVECTDDDFRSMLDGGVQVAMQLFFSGKLKVTGDPALASRLSKLLQMASSGDVKV